MYCHLWFSFSWNISYYRSHTKHVQQNVQNIYLYRKKLHLKSRIFQTFILPQCFRPEWYLKLFLVPKLTWNIISRKDPTMPASYIYRWLFSFSFVRIKPSQHRIRCRKFSTCWAWSHLFCPSPCITCKMTGTSKWTK